MCKVSFLKYINLVWIFLQRPEPNVEACWYRCDRFLTLSLW